MKDMVLQTVACNYRTEIRSLVRSLVRSFFYAIPCCVLAVFYGYDVWECIYTFFAIRAVAHVVISLQNASKHVEKIFCKLNLPLTEESKRRAAISMSFSFAISSVLFIGIIAFANIAVAISWWIVEIVLSVNMLAVARAKYRNLDD